jgi:sortase A
VATTSPTLPPTSLPVWNPDRIVIPAIKLDAPTVPAKIQSFQVQGQQVQEWVAPNVFAAGWLTASVPLGVPGNTVLVGHHNLDGEVFGHLVDLKVGDLILMYSGNTEFAYQVALTLILPERFQPLDVRLANARWIEPSNDERLTLVTCWPYASNTHRLIVVATRVSLAAVQYDPLTLRLTPHPPLDWQSTPSIPPQDVLPTQGSTASSQSMRLTSPATARTS